MPKTIITIEVDHDNPRLTTHFNRPLTTVKSIKPGDDISGFREMRACTRRQAIYILMSELPAEAFKIEQVD